jgi:ferredoxin
LSQLVKDEDWQRQASALFQMPIDALKEMPADEIDAMGAVMMKDETTCIRCGACASRCPTHAVTMKEFRFYRECVSIPSPNPKLNYGSQPASE